MQKFLFLCFISFFKIGYAQGDSCSYKIDSIRMDTIYFISEQNPEFPGGLDSLHKFIIENIDLKGLDPVICYQGVVYSEFVVNTDGSIDRIQILKGFEPHSSRVIELIRKFPRWIPAKCKEKSVAYKYVLPIKFNLH